MSDNWRDDPRFGGKEKPTKKKEEKKENVVDISHISHTDRKKAKVFWNQLPPGDKGDYRDFNDFVINSEWGTATDRLKRQSPSSVMEFYGVDYPKKLYLEKFIPECYTNFKLAVKGTVLRNTKIKISIKNEGKYWNSKSKYPISQNEFISKFFNNEEDKVKGLEGIWEEDTWGLVGVVKKGSYYQRYNICIDHFDSEKPSKNFDGGGINFWDMRADFPESEDLDVDGTMDGAYIPTTSNKKFKYECRHIILAQVGEAKAPINIESTMQATLLRDGLLEVRPPYGNDVLKSERLWPRTTDNAEDDERGSVSGASGTAFFVDDKGHLITNYHVVRGSKDNLKIIYQNKEVSAKVINKDPKLDLALLKTDIKNKSYIKISDKIPYKSQEILCAGFPLGSSLSDDVKVSRGVVSSLKGFKNNTAHITTDVAINSGNSGGPMVDVENGQLVAVAVSVMRQDNIQGINFGIKATQVKDFLDSNRIKNKKWSIGRSLKRSDIVSLLENSTVYVFFK